MNCNKPCSFKKCPKVPKHGCGCCPFRKVVIPEVLGDDSEGSDYAPENGAYQNALVEYKANGAMYIYSSDGIYTKVTGIGGASDYGALTNKPSINSHELVGNKSFDDLGIDINDATLTVKQGETTLGTFSANASENVEINVGDIYEIVTISGEENDYYEVYKNGVLIEDLAEAYRAIFEDAAPQEIRWRESPGAVCYHKCIGTVLNFIGGNGSESEECGYEALIYSLALNSNGTFSVSSSEITFSINLRLGMLYSGGTFIPNGTYRVDGENPVYRASDTNYDKLNLYFMQRGEGYNTALSASYGQTGYRLVLGDVGYDTENGQTVIRMDLMNVSRQEIYSIIFRSDSTYTVTNRYKITTTGLMNA